MRSQASDNKMAHHGAYNRDRDLEAEWRYSYLHYCCNAQNGGGIVKAIFLRADEFSFSMYEDYNNNDDDNI